MTHWPLHVTVVPRFSIDMSAEALFSLTKNLVRNQTPATAIAADDEYFGEDNSVHVTLLDMSDELIRMHMHLYTELQKAGAVFDEPKYCGQNYRAHVTVQKSGRLQRGDSVLVDQLTLVDMFHAQDIRGRKILDTVTLGS